MLQVKESNLKKLLIAVGFKTAGKWPQRRLQSKLNDLYELKADLEMENLDKPQKQLITSIFRSLKKSVPSIVVADGVDSPKFLKDDKVVHASGTIYKVVKSPYLVGQDITINAIELNKDGKSKGDIKQMLVNDFVRDASEEDVANPPEKTRIPKAAKKTVKKISKEPDAKIDRKKEPIERKKKAAKKAKKESGPRVSIGSTIYEYFDKVGVEKATFVKALQLAKRVKPGTAFNEGHLSWYQNTYRKEHGLEKPPRKNAKKAKASKQEVRTAKHGASDIRKELKKRMDVRKEIEKASDARKEKEAKETTKKALKKSTKKTTKKDASKKAAKKVTKKTAKK